ncbi:MAG: hypothetical protein HON68_04745 [Gammaproteobacteria bacterium]|jgi:signal transduction histidine kinase|nr:hypothetical protein [Gammaproteobacteria bacterium]MBT3489746.1 hypothetical protein [Gammaproteobacteria bacterium]MBT3719707.1 hypothetical protein [Gammaproteobacteria bacterium]MBT3845481.1 hypothetical protein [Gammaproteobacteria bacterium]MBT3892884.1 hypothetical protein [Gammaproteobacteria bacterium]
MQWSELVANHLHDLKNRLGVLMQQIDSSQDEKKLEMQQSSRQIHDDLIALLTLFRLEQQELRVDRYDLPLSDALQEAAGREEVLLKASGIELEIDCSAAAMGFYDRPLIVSVLAHGILNAIHAGASRIVLGAEEQDRCICFSIDDNGKGLGSKQVDLSEMKGVGVGLRLGEEIAKAHRRRGQTGSIQLQPSEQLGGAQLLLWIP